MFPGPDSMGFVWGGVGRALMQFMHFSAIFAMFVDLGDPVVPTLRGGQLASSKMEVFETCFCDIVIT